MCLLIQLVVFSVLNLCVSTSVRADTVLFPYYVIRRCLF